MKFHYDDQDGYSYDLQYIDEGFGFTTTEGALMGILDKYLDHYSEEHALKIKLDMSFPYRGAIYTTAGEKYTWSFKYKQYLENHASGLDAIPWSNADTEIET